MRAKTENLYIKLQQDPIIYCTLEDKQKESYRLLL